MWKPERISPFFGSDLEGGIQNCLKKLEHGGWSLLPLDVPALGIASSSRLPYTMLEDWIGPETIKKSIHAGEECSSLWHQAAREDFISSGICWPEFDRHAMYWFWTNAIIADALAEAFRAGKVEKMLFISRNEMRAGVYYDPSDITTQYWRSALRDTIAVENISLSSGWLRSGTEVLRNGIRPLSRLFRGNAGRGHWEGRDFGITKELHGKIVLAFNPGEFHRFTPSAEKLLQALPGQMGGIILSDSREEAERISQQWKMPIAAFPILPEQDRRLKDRFENAFLKSKASGLGKPWEAVLEHLSYHFRYYCSRRWPMLDSTFRQWISLWRDIDPRAVITSSLEDAESMLPSQAAREYGCTTISIPHGGIQSKTTEVLPCDYVLQSFPIQSFPYRKAGIASRRLIRCREVIAESEYETSSGKCHLPEMPWRVLGLTGPVGFPDNLPLLSMKGQLEALETLARPPRDLSQILGLKIKTHPNASYADIELLSLAGLHGQIILPPRSNLHAVLKGFDLVVAVNYVGTAIIHALLAGKPLVLFYSNPLLGEPGLSIPAKLFLEAGAVVREPEQIWPAIRNFFRNPLKAIEMRAQAAEFVRKYLDNTNSPDIVEVLGGILSGKPGGVPKGSADVV